MSEDQAKKLEAIAEEVTGPKAPNKIDQTFDYHAFSPDAKNRSDALRAKVKELAHLFVDVCPDSAEKTLASRKLEEFFMWANKAIAVNQ